MNLRSAIRRFAGKYVMFDNAQDANAYLRRTVCMWGNQPIWVHSVAAAPDGKIVASACKLPLQQDHNDKYDSYDIHDPKFNCRLFSLGYMTSSKGALFYVSRTPSREQPQGLSQSNTRFQRTGDINGIGMNLGGALYEPGFVDMLMGRYADPMEAVKRLQSEPKLVGTCIGPFLAVTRHHKFKDLFFLEYKGREVSFSQTLEFNLPTEFKHLLEVCQPSGLVKKVA